MNEVLNRRGYIHGWEKSAEPNSNRTDYRFCEFAKDAAYWDTRESAQHACDIFNMGIEIPSALGGIHVCRDFQVEEVSAIHYVVFCEAPFIVKEARGHAE